ncbi:peptidase domain-containing ABC transporter [Burkholderia sp. RS02]|uniref:peptidase domain-containing ABC transporter n=1 Tax=unclassified Burkholderia TaxID=2613784 RepID=UPI003218734E
MDLGLHRIRTSLKEALVVEAGASPSSDLLACVVALANHRGANLSFTKLQKLFLGSSGLDERGAVGRVCELAGVVPRQMRIGRTALRHVPLPVIVRSPAHGYVVLQQVGLRFATVAMPNEGNRRLPLDQLGGDTLDVLDVHLPARESTRGNDVPWRYRDLLGRIRGKAASGVPILVLGLCLEAFSLVLPQYGQLAVDRFIPYDDRLFLMLLSAAFLVVVLLRGLTDLARGWALAVAGASINVQWMGTVLRKLLDLPLSFFAGKEVGNLTSRFNGVFGIQGALAATVFESLMDALLVLVTASMMLFYSPLLTLLPCVAIIAYTATRAAFLYLLRTASTVETQASSEQSSFLIDMLSNVQTVKLANSTGRFWSVWMQKLVAQKNAGLRTQKYHLLFKLARDVTFGTERIVVTGMACLLVSGGHFSMGMVFAFVAYKEQFSHRAALLVDRFFDIRALQFQTSRIAEIMNTANEVRAHHNLLSDVAQTVTFKGVSFRYRGMKPLLFEQLSFSLRAGETVALHGPSGCGKTTVFRLLLRIQDGYNGSIRIGDQELDTYGGNELRALFASVLQDDGLFEGTVLDNVCLYDPDVEMARVIDALRLACVEDEVRRLPKGLHTVVTASGAPLSRGQRDRVLIARALYRAPRFLLLDEATGGLDDETAVRILRNIATLGLPTLVITHSPAVIAVATRAVSIGG